MRTDFRISSDCLSDNGSHFSLGYAYADSFPNHPAYTDRRYTNGEILKTDMMKAMKALKIRVDENPDSKLGLRKIHECFYTDGKAETWLGYVEGLPFLTKFWLQTREEPEPEVPSDIDPDVHNQLVDYGCNPTTDCTEPASERLFKPHTPSGDPYTVIDSWDYMTAYAGPLMDKFATEYYKYAVENKPKAPKDSVHIITPLPGGGMTLRKYNMDTKTYKDDIVEDNYNDDFKEPYEKLLKYLKDDGSGIVIFSGDPGTGKTSMITHLTTKAKDLDRKIVMLPSEFTSALSDPGFLTFAIDNLKNTILIIEDAENSLESRAGGARSGSVSNILNMTDGILGKLIGAKIICTVNVTENIDEAIERKGRMKMKYHFGLLTADKATALSKKLGINKEYDKPTTLAEVYNEEEKNNYVEKKKGVGFIIGQNK